MSKPACPGGRRCHTCSTGFVGDCTQKNVVYEIRCELCRQDGHDCVYIGETKRPLRLRFNEHVRDLKNRTPDTPMGEHFQASHSNISVDGKVPLTVKVMYRSKDHPDRKIAESLMIRNHRPRLNSNDSSWPILWNYMYVQCTYMCVYVLYVLLWDTCEWFGLFIDVLVFTWFV